MTQSIRDAGFTPVPEDVRMTVSGILELRAGRIVLVLDGMTVPRDLTCVDAASGAAHAAGLTGHAGQKVEIEGRWLFREDGLLEVESIK